MPRVPSKVGKKEGDADVASASGGGEGEGEAYTIAAGGASDGTIPDPPAAHTRAATESSSTRGADASMKSGFGGGGGMPTVAPSLGGGSRGGGGRTIKRVVYILPSAPMGNTMAEYRIEAAARYSVPEANVTLMDKDGEPFPPDMLVEDVVGGFTATVVGADGMTTVWEVEFSREGEGLASSSDDPTSSKPVGNKRKRGLAAGDTEGEGDGDATMDVGNA